MNLKKLSILGLLTFPSLALATGGPDPGLAIIGLGLLILVPFLLFFLIGHFRDRQHRLRYASLCIFSAGILTLFLLFFGINFLQKIGIFISYEFSTWDIFILSFFGGIFFAEYKVKKGKTVTTLKD